MEQNFDIDEQENDDLSHSVFGTTTSKTISGNQSTKSTVEHIEDIENIDSPESVLNEFYKLKNKYELEIMKNKKIIMNNLSLSPKEKRQEYLKLKPKCINCKRPGGTIFSVKYFPFKEKENKEYKEFRARCGILANPCNLNITIQTGIYNLLPEIIDKIEEEIKESKNNIIDSKNKLLFGFITTETALQGFNDEKEIVDSYTSLLEEYLNVYLKITNNEEKNVELNESLEKSYELIANIKESIRLYNDSENTQYVKDAVDIYITTLQPLLRKIMTLKYKQNYVHYDDNNNTFHLIQRKTNIKSLEYTSFVDKVLSNVVGYMPITDKAKPKGLLLESSSDTEIIPKESIEPIISLKPSAQQNKFILKPNIIRQQEKSTENQEYKIPQDYPIYGNGKDGVKWHMRAYNELWDKLPLKLTTALKGNEEWMNQFMFNCVNSQANGNKCKMIAPSNLLVPPNQIVLPNGEYDFGVPIYNEVYNKLSPLDKKNYLLFSTTKDGVKHYSDDMFKNMMNKLVEKEVGYDIFNKF